MPLRSTDMDLLVAQKALGKLRHPELNDSQLVSLVDQARSKLSVRFVDMTSNSKDELVPTHTVHHTYDMSASFQLRLTTAKNGQYVLRADLGARGVTGYGSTHKECLQDAKERFRLHLGKSIRDAHHKLYKRFLKDVNVQVVKPAEKAPAKDQVNAKELFRRFIGNNLRDSDSKVYKQFFQLVKFKEVRLMKVCVTCKKERPAEVFATDSLECFTCAPPSLEEVGEDFVADSEDLN